MNVSPRTQSLLNRLPKDHPLAPAMRDAMIAALSAAEQFSGHKVALSADRRMTPLGQRQALQDALTGNHGKALARARAPVEKARKEIKARRDALVVKPIDKADIAGELQRAEIRTWIRSLDQGVRQSVVASSSDRRILEAALSAPPQLSGIVDPKAAAEIENRYVEIVYASELASIEAADSVVAVGEMAVNIARNELRSTVDMHPHDFDELMRPIETIKPLLTSDRKQIIEIDGAGKASYRPATQSDIDNGIVYGSDEHKAAQLAA